MSEGNYVTSQTKLFLGGLDWKIRGRDLNDYFSKFGEVVFARVKLDNETGKSRGFGFVEFQNPEDASKAQVEMNGQEFMGRVIKVDFAQDNLDRIQAKQDAEVSE